MLPSISIVIPTYNSERVLADCLSSILGQDYPKDKIEVLVIDGGSTDSTLKIASSFKVRTLSNPLRTGEAGKAVGIKAALNEVILLQDSDNILDGADWLQRMVEPLADESIVGAEPLCYSYRRKDSLVTRYCALLGMNDPISLYLGTYDRYSYVTGRWTDMDIETVDKGNYVEITLSASQIPTMGANGFMARRLKLQELGLEPYMFDVDAICMLVLSGNKKLAKVKIGIVHLFAPNIATFIRKTWRRIRDFTFYERRGYRKYPWKSLAQRKAGIFTLYSLALIPVVRDSVKGYRRKPDRAWLFHPMACCLTLVIYSIYFLRNSLGRKV